MIKKKQKSKGEFQDEFGNTIYTTALAAIILQAPNGKLALYERSLVPAPLEQPKSENPEQVKMPKAK